MDNNLNIPVTNTTTPEPATPQGPEASIPPAQPTPSTTVTANVPPPEDTKKPIMMLIIGAFLVLAIVGGIYFYLSSQQQAPKEEAAIQTPSPSPTEDLESEVDAIDVESTASSEFDAVDQDLNQL